MIKKGRICSIYFLILIFIGVIATHNETIGTAIRLIIWFAIPMSLSFFLEMLVVKMLTYRKVIIYAILNTIIMFVVLLLIGIGFLANSNLIHY